MPEPTPHRFFFVHVMKTSGSTFRSHLHDQFPGACFPGHFTEDERPILDNLLVSRVLELPPEVHARIRAYSGHFPFVVPSLIDPALVTLTMLREPISRIVSHLKHTKRVEPRHHDHSLEEIYEDPWTFPLFLHDHQVKVLAMTRDDKLESVMDVIDIDDDRMRIALDHLRSVDVLGFTDRHDEFLAECERRFGITHTPARGRWRAATEDWTPSAELLRRIERDNQRDVEFYELALEHAAERAR